MNTIRKLLLVYFSLVCAPSLVSAAISLEMTSSANLAELHPQHDAVKIQVQIKNSLGQPSRGTKLHLHLKAPATQSLYSTDFPVVEASPLMDGDVIAEDGRFSFAFVPPIRGEYRLSAKAIDPQTGAVIQEEWPILIHENPVKKQNLAIFLSLIVFVGGLSGWILARGAKLSSSSLIALLCCSCWALAEKTSPVYAHGSEDHGTNKAGVASFPISNAIAEAPSGYKLELQMLSSHARVGELAEFHGSLRNAADQAVPARFRLHFTQLEHGVEVFSSEFYEPSGSLVWKGQLYDGSNHKIELEAWPLQEPAQSLHTEIEVPVEAIAPPLPAVLKSFGSLMLAAALSLCLGMGLGLRRAKQDRILG
ncbi:MAG: hypothetical protein NTX25_13560 [Proteobacteria bacterium]|nr:hypothetical protein [Pseudomonadota bacterium]